MENRARREFNCIKRRLDAVPESLVKLMIDSDINTAKIIALIAAMATDILLFELMYEVYRIKLNMDEDALKDADINMFFNRKIEQSDIVAGWSDSVIKKLKQTYCKYMQAAGLLGEPVKNERKINRYVKQLNEMRIYYQALSHLALQKIEIDLDDGVKHNYQLFQGVEVIVDGGKKQKVDLLAKI